MPTHPDIGDQAAHRAPVLPMPATRTANLSDQLRRAITESGLSCRALGKKAGIDHALVRRFVTGERDIKLNSASRIAAVLGLCDDAFPKGTTSKRAAVKLPARNLPVRLWGKSKKSLSPAEYGSLKVLVEAGPDGLTRSDMDALCPFKGWRQLLSKLRRSDADWEKAIGTPDGRHGGKWRFDIQALKIKRTRE